MYGYLNKNDAQGKHFSIPQGQVIAGYAIGIVLLDVWYPLLPGNVVNATTYKYPVRHKRIPGGTQERIHGADPTVVDLIVDTCRELEQEGVRAIVGACGYLGNFQRQVAAAVNVPVFLSSLLQAPMIHRALKPGQSIGVMCADGPAITPHLLESCGVTPDIPLAIMGLEDQPEFGNILYSRGQFDYDKLEHEVVTSAQRLVAGQPEIGALLLECSDLPPLACAIQRAVQLPVFDFITMINWVYQATVQQPYEGYC